MNQKFKKYFPPLIGILAIFAVWYIVCRAGILSSYVLPSPGRVFQSFCKMLQSGELFRDLRISFLRVGKGFVIAFILAFAFGMLRAMIPASAGYYEYLVQFFKNVPPLSMIPLLILWCGIGETTKTVIIVLASFFPNVFKHRQRDLRAVTRSFWRLEPCLATQNARNFSASCCPTPWRTFS